MRNLDREVRVIDLDLQSLEFQLKRGVHLHWGIVPKGGGANGIIQVVSKLVSTEGEFDKLLESEAKAVSGRTGESVGQVKDRWTKRHIQVGELYRLTTSYAPKIIWEHGAAPQPTGDSQEHSFAGS